MRLLITGGTGFVGRALIPRLAERHHQPRLLLRPSQISPRLPRGVPVDVALSRLDDIRGLRASLAGVDAVFHLAGAVRRWARGGLLLNSVRRTRALAPH